MFLQLVFEPSQSFGDNLERARFFRLFEVQERLCEDLDFKNIRSEKIYRRNLALTHLQLSLVCLELKRLQASIPIYYDGPYS